MTGGKMRTVDPDLWTGEGVNCRPKSCGPGGKMQTTILLTGQ